MSDHRFPKIHVSAEQLNCDPYPLYRKMQDSSPIFWLENLSMWLVVQYDLVDEIMKNSENFVAGTADSLVYDTFGEHMLTSDGDVQMRFKSKFRSFFNPAAIRRLMENKVAHCSGLILDDFIQDGAADFRKAYASRLPVLSILSLFDMPIAEERLLRTWYDGFERALSNFAWNEDIRMRARSDVREFHQLVQKYVEIARQGKADGLLGHIANDPSDDRLTDEEIYRNLSIIFFGGISTVEAVILNCLYVFCTNQDVHEEVLQNPDLVPQLIEETVRWLSPVQSATRHVASDITIGDVTFRKGDTVNCMLGAANRDPRIFENPDDFCLHRKDVRKHLAFASGPHFCLGSNLARLEAATAIRDILARCRDLRLSKSHAVEIRGFEFRQPTALHLEWHI